MGGITEALKSGLESWPALTLLGFATVAMVLALITLGLSARLVRMFSTLKSYDAAMQKVEAIEAQLGEMTQAMREVEMDYEKSLAEEKAAHDREVFDLQQLIFERNAEVLALKTDVLEMRRLYPYDN